MRSIEASPSFSTRGVPEPRGYYKSSDQELVIQSLSVSYAHRQADSSCSPARRSRRKILLSYWRDLLPLGYNVLHSRNQELAHWPVPFSCPRTGPTTLAGPIPRACPWARAGAASAAPPAANLLSRALLSCSNCAIWAMPPVAPDCLRNAPPTPSAFPSPAIADRALN